MSIPPVRVGYLYPCEILAYVVFDEAGEPRYLVVDDDVYRIVKTTGRARSFRKGWRTHWLTYTTWPDREGSNDATARPDGRQQPEPPEPAA